MREERGRRQLVLLGLSGSARIQSPICSVSFSIHIYRKGVQQLINKQSFSISFFSSELCNDLSSVQPQLNGKQHTTSEYVPQKASVKSQC